MVELDSGPPFRFGEIRVLGTRRYSDELVKNLSPVHPGADYDRDKLVVYQRVLLGSLRASDEDAGVAGEEQEVMVL